MPQIQQTVELASSADTVFLAWLDSKTHGEMIDGSAKIVPKEKGDFSIWDGTVTGKTLTIDRSKHIITQSWRYDYDDWPEDEPSIIKLTIQPKSETSCTLIFEQDGVPEQYKDDIAQGWQDYYWQPMKEYFL